MKSILLLVTILISSFVYGQRKVSGTITDEFGPIPNVNITIKNTKKGTSTNENGLYYIKARPTDTLRISYIGYEPKDILVGHVKDINAQLKNYQELDEVVIVAYGSTRNKSICCRCFTTKSYDEIIAEETERISFSETIKLYPNPSKEGVFTMKLLEDISEANIIVADLAGRIILNKIERKRSSNVVVDLSNQSSGIYIINIFSNGTQIASKKAIRL